MATNEHWIFSSGGGTQSSAALVLSAEGIFPYTTHIFCNVGDDSEDKDTLRWVADVLLPYAEKHNINFKVAKKTGKTLLQSIQQTKYSIPIPAKFYYENGKKHIGYRACTNDWKIRVSDRAIRQLFGDKKDQPLVHVALGISTDEVHRARTDGIERMGASGNIPDENKNHYWNKQKEYPFIFCDEFELFGKVWSKSGKGLSREDCKLIVQLSGLGTPPRSACWFCPFRPVNYWKEHKLNNTDIYKNGIELELLLQEKSLRQEEKHRLENKPHNKFRVYLTDKEINISELSTEMGNERESLDNCESGYCFV